MPRKRNRSNLSASSGTNLGETMQPPSAKRYCHQRETWENHRELICDLYRRKPLKVTREVLNAKFGFTASDRKYKDMFREWGIRKNNRTEKRISSLVAKKTTEKETSTISASPDLLSSPELHFADAEMELDNTALHDQLLVNGIPPEANHYQTAYFERPYLYPVEPSSNILGLQNQAVHNHRVTQPCYPNNTYYAQAQLDMSLDQTSGPIFEPDPATTVYYYYDGTAQFQPSVSTFNY